MVAVALLEMIGLRLKNEHMNFTHENMLKSHVKYVARMFLTCETCGVML